VFWHLQRQKVPKWSESSFAYILCFFPVQKLYYERSQKSPIDNPQILYFFSADTFSSSVCSASEHQNQASFQGRKPSPEKGTGSCRICLPLRKGGPPAPLGPDFLNFFKPYFFGSLGYRGWVLARPPFAPTVGWAFPVSHMRMECGPSDIAPSASCDFGGGRCAQALYSTSDPKSNPNRVRGHVCVCACACARVGV